MSRVWFITGCSTGFGRELATGLVEKGDSVAATSRNPDDVKDILASAPDRVIAPPLDVTKPDQIQAAVDVAIEKFGQIDVLVNNAGYGEFGTLEEMNDAEARRQFDVNVFGVLNVLRAALPPMREKRSGHVLNISSIASLRAGATVGMYCATKHALEAFSDALRKELAPFGIKVISVLPGGFRTDFAGRSMNMVDCRIEDYREEVEDTKRRMEEYHNNQPGDPKKAAQAMIKIVDEPEPPNRLLLGSDCYEAAKKELTEMLEEFDRWESVSRSTDIETANA